jgi:GT2 family glycosyltransferase
MERAPISVLVRTKDRPRRLTEALESVVAQTIAPLEAIVVNDGGEPVDHLLAPYSRRLPLHSLLHATPRGRAAAANAGLTAASGAWIAMLDDDDLFLPDHLATLWGAARSVSAAPLVYAACRVERPGRPAEVLGAPFEREALALANSIPTCAAIFSREAALAVKGFDESLPFLEDWDLWLRLAGRGAFVFVNAVTSVYRAGEASVGGAMADERWRAMEALLAKHWAIVRPGHLVRRLHALEQDIEALRLQSETLRRKAEDGSAERERLREETRFIRDLADAHLLGPTWWLHRAWEWWRRVRGKDGP